MAGSVVKLVVKSAVAGSLIYATLRASNSPWSVARYTESKRNTDIFLPIDQKASTTDTMKETWNNGVQKFFLGLHEAPSMFKEMAGKAVHRLKETYKNPDK